MVDFNIRIESVMEQRILNQRELYMKELTKIQQNMEVKKMLLEPEITFSPELSKVAHRQQLVNYVQTTDLKVSQTNQ